MLLNIIFTSSVCFPILSTGVVVCVSQDDVLSRSDGELVADRFSIFNCLYIVVEEIDVEAGLQEGGKRLRPAEEALSLISVDPIEDVEEAVESEAGHVMAG